MKEKFEFNPRFFTFLYNDIGTLLKYMYMNIDADKGFYELFTGGPNLRMYSDGVLYIENEGVGRWEIFDYTNESFSIILNRLRNEIPADSLNFRCMWEEIEAVVANKEHIANESIKKSNMDTDEDGWV